MAVIRRRRVPADRGNSRGRRGGGAGASSSGCAPASTHRLVIDGQGRVAAIRTTFARIEVFTGVQQAGATACVGVASGEDGEIAGRVVVAIFPAGGPAADGDGKLWASTRVVAETGDEGSCTAWCCGGS